MLSRLGAFSLDDHFYGITQCTKSITWCMAVYDPAMHLALFVP